MVTETGKQTNNKLRHIAFKESLRVNKLKDQSISCLWKINQCPTFNPTLITNFSHLSSKHTKHPLGPSQYKKAGPMPKII